MSALTDDIFSCYVMDFGCRIRCFEEHDVLFVQYTTHSKTMLVWSHWMETIGMMLEITVYRLVYIIQS